MTIGQYRLTDTFLFAVILAVFELIVHYAQIAFGGLFTFSPLLPIVLLVMMRWGWQAVFYAVLDGVLFCLLKGYGWEQYLSFAIGNAFVMFLLFATKFFGKKKIAGKWYFSALFVLLGWLLMAFGRTIVATCCGGDFLALLKDEIVLPQNLLTLAMGLVIILVLRRFEGMFEDQKTYLKRKEEERKEKLRRDTYGDEPVEIDEATLSILNKRYDDLD